MLLNTVNFMVMQIKLLAVVDLLYFSRKIEENRRSTLEARALIYLTSFGHTRQKHITLETMPS